MLDVSSLSEPCRMQHIETNVTKPNETCMNEKNLLSRASRFGFLISGQYNVCPIVTENKLINYVAGLLLLLLSSIHLISAAKEHYFVSCLNMTFD